jgi:hypothetical protein
MDRSSSDKSLEVESESPTVERHQVQLKKIRLEDFQLDDFKTLVAVAE